MRYGRRMLSGSDGRTQSFPRRWHAGTIELALARTDNGGVAPHPRASGLLQSPPFGSSFFAPSLAPRQPALRTREKEHTNMFRPAPGKPIRFVRPKLREHNRNQMGSRRSDS